MMIKDKNTSKQQLSDPSPDVESDHVEAAPTADNITATASPSDSLFDEKSKHRLSDEQLKLELARTEADFIQKQATLDKRLSGYRDMVATQRNRISKLEADLKAIETELKAKLRSAQLAAKENIGSLLACVSGGKIEAVKAKKELLDSMKSLAKALKTGSGSAKKVKALELLNSDLQNDLAVTRSNLKDATKPNKENKRQLDNQLAAKNQLKLSLAKIDLKKHEMSLSCELEKKRKRDDIHRHNLAEIAARKAFSKRVKEVAASHKNKIKEKALEVSNQRVQTMMETYQGTNSGQFSNGRTKLVNESSCTANLPAKDCRITLLFFPDGC
jgi:hypothetical protein